MGRRSHFTVRWDSKNFQRIASSYWAPYEAKGSYKGHNHLWGVPTPSQAELWCACDCNGRMFCPGADPSTAQFSHALMRDHLRHCFEVQALTDFPPPQAKEKIVNVSGEGIVEFKVPKLWHKLVAISPPKPKKLKK